MQDKSAQLELNGTVYRRTVLMFWKSNQTFVGQLNPINTNFINKKSNIWIELNDTSAETNTLPEATIRTCISGVMTADSHTTTTHWNKGVLD